MRAVHHVRLRSRHVRHFRHLDPLMWSFKQECVGDQCPATLTLSRRPHGNEIFETAFQDRAEHRPQVDFKQPDKAFPTGVHEEVVAIGVKRNHSPKSATLGRTPR